MSVEALALKLPVEVRWHGRGGQGVVTASRLLAEAALKEGLFPQSLPDFGAERSGAPLMAYTRVGREHPQERGHVLEPQVVVVLDSTLLGRVKILEGLIQGGILVVNTSASCEALVDRLQLRDLLVCTVDATGIAMKLLGRNIPNSPVLGAFLRVVPIVPLGVMEETIKERLGLRMGAKVVQANLEALHQGYQRAQVRGVAWN